MIGQQILNFLGNNFIDILIIGGVIYGGYRLWIWYKEQKGLKRMFPYNESLNNKELNTTKEEKQNDNKEL